MDYPDYEDDRDCSKSQESYRRDKVMGGRDALMGEFPWSVFIELNGKMCGGTLVSKRHIITAAHCFSIGKTSGRCSIRHMYPKKTVLKYATAVVGGICRKEDKSVKCTGEKVGKRIRIKSAHYEGFFKESCSGTRDIALVELEKNVPDGVHHACLPHLHNVDELDESTTRLFSSGWRTNPLHGTIRSAAPIQQLTDLGTTFIFQTFPIKNVRRGIAKISTLRSL
ncbi:trypsin [Cooperia oncophora]